MKILLIGKSGQLGGDLIRNNAKHEICAPGREILDLSSPDGGARIIAEHKPDVVINTAAFHNVPQCETDPVTAFLINCVAVRNLAIACRQVDSLFVTFSSDYVFGGEKRTPYLENDRPGPLQLYGISRLAGEFAALSSAPDHAVIIRTCGLYGMSGASSKGGNFVDKRVKDAGSRSILEMGSDQIVGPTSTDDLSQAVLKLIDHPRLAPGIYHLVNEGECSWYEFTKAIYDIMGSAVAVIPVDRGGKSGDMRRPLYSVLANTRASAIGISLPPWQDALRRYLENKYGIRAESQHE
jgi:dTDP-4-dehydrorhamnose reductase